MLPSSKSNRGFSLIELALILAIVSLLMTGFLEMYKQSQVTATANNTSQNANAIAAALGAHYLIYGTLPCPASPILAPSAAPVADSGGNLIAAGQGDCYIANPGHPGGTLPAAPAGGPPNFAFSPPTCDAPTGICASAGWRASAVGLLYNGNNPTIKDPVLIGTVPYYDLALPFSASLDGYNNRFTYAVSYYDTQLAALNAAKALSPSLNLYDIGAINIQVYSASGGGISNGFYGKTSSITCPGGAPNPAVSTCWPIMYQSPGTYMVAVFSAGPDGKGAWNLNGKKPIACPQGGAAPYPLGADVENCNGDATFLLSAGTTDGNMYNMVAGPNYYDDSLVISDFTVDVDKWSIEGANGTMSNSLGGNVGVGTGNTPGPLYPLDVNGNIMVDAYLQADNLCDASGNNCFSQSLLEGTGMACSGAIATGIANQAIICAQQVNLTGITPSTCPSSPLNLVTGIDPAGNLICTPAP